MLKLYENIKELRKDNNWTQDELAKRLGYTDRSTIAKIEAGKVDLSQSKIMEFASVFGVKPGDLMGWDIKDAIDEYIQSDRDKAVLLDSMVRNEQKKQQEKAAELYSLYENASPEIQSAVELLLKSAQQSPGSPNNS